MENQNAWVASQSSCSSPSWCDWTVENTNRGCDYQLYQHVSCQQQTPLFGENSKLHLLFFSNMSLQTDFSVCGGKTLKTHKLHLTPKKFLSSASLDSQTDVVVYYVLRVNGQDSRAIGVRVNSKSTVDELVHLIKKANPTRLENVDPGDIFIYQSKSHFEDGIQVCCLKESVLEVR